MNLIGRALIICRNSKFRNTVHIRNYPIVQDKTRNSYILKFFFKKLSGRTCIGIFEYWPLVSSSSTLHVVFQTCYLFCYQWTVIIFILAFGGFCLLVCFGMVGIDFLTRVDRQPSDGGSRQREAECRKGRRAEKQSHQWRGLLADNAGVGCEGGCSWCTVLRKASCPLLQAPAEIVR